MITGSCCCGQVKFSLSAQPKSFGICHCGRCRKLGASEFVIVEQHAFQWLAGEELVAVYVPEPPHRFRRYFCSHCGTQLGEMMSGERSFPVNVNCLDDEPGIPVTFHEYVTDKPSWQTIPHDVKCFDTSPSE